MAAAGSGEQRQALLGDAREEELWAHVVSMAPPAGGPSVQELVRESPDRVIQTLQRSGIQQVAEFCLPDKLVLGRLGDDKILTRESGQAEENYEAAWRRELGPCCEAPRRSAALDSGSQAGSGRVQKEQEWCADIPVAAFVVSVRDAAAPAAEGLLRPLIRRWQAGGCTTATFQLPVVQAVVDWKWRFCRRVLIGELLLFLLWLASFFVFALSHRVEDASMSLSQLLSTGRCRLAVTAELTGQAAMLPFLWTEACTAAAYKLSWLLDARRLLGLSTYALQFFSRVFPATRYAFVEDVSQVLHDLKWFLLFLAAVMAGFATAFVVLFRPDVAEGRGKREFDGLFRSSVTMLSWVAGDPNLTLLYTGVAHHVAACLLGASYIFIFVLILSTLLISLMTTTLQKVTQDEAARMLLSKALISTSWKARLLRRLFPRMHARFIHVLRVNPDKLDAVRLDRLWKSMSDEEAAGLQGRTAGAPPPAASGTAPPPPHRAGRRSLPPLNRLASGGSAASEHQRKPSGGMPAATEMQSQHHRLAPMGAASAAESAPGEPPPSVRWRGSLMDAYLGGRAHVGGGSEGSDALAYQRVLLGEGDMDAQSEGEHGMPATSSELAAIHEEIRELRQLVVAALGQLPGGTSAVKTR